MDRDRASFGVGVAVPLLAGGRTRDRLRLERSARGSQPLAERVGHHRKLYALSPGCSRLKENDHTVKCDHSGIRAAGNWPSHAAVTMDAMEVVLRTPNARAVVDSRAFLPSSSRSFPPSVRPPEMQSATVHVAADDLHLTGSYEATGDVLYLLPPATRRVRRHSRRRRDTPSDSIATVASRT